ncbi:hypothetical protein EYR36_001840 [Pleurotus pulmonarius]|nr:hypothetical protein EYR36_008219 [Pleurotus pulmonarius]KAF4580020.1 hypothetical protein EYR36_001840 [Pleurotus pulmonarius]
MSYTDYQRHRIYVEAILIRVKSPTLDLAGGQTRWLSLSLKVDNEIREDRDRWIWENLDWTFQSPVELCAGSRALIEVRPGVSTTAGAEVLAEVTFEDIIAATRSREHAVVDFQREHHLATITLRVRVSNSPTPEQYPDPAQNVRRRDSLKSRVLGYLERPFRRNERSEVQPNAPQDNWAAATPYSPPRLPPDWRDPAGMYLPAPATPMYDPARPWPNPIPQMVSPQAWVAPEPSDTGKIEYTVVGTRRPKPR